MILITLLIHFYIGKKNVNHFRAPRLKTMYILFQAYSLCMCPCTIFFVLKSIFLSYNVLCMFVLLINIFKKSCKRLTFILLRE